MTDDAKAGEYVLVPVLLDEDMAAALECQFSTEGQWKAVLAARPAALVELREAEEAVIGLATQLHIAEASYRRAHDLSGDGSRESGRAWDYMRRTSEALKEALVRRNRALAAVEKNTGAKG